MEKHKCMKSFINAANEYVKHPSETTASILQRNLGTIGASLDLSIFDPGSSEAVEFYVSLHELTNSLASRSPLMWSAVAVLQHACKNSTAKNALIHTFKFTPILTRLLEANLTAEKRIRVLQLLQELTYGVKISWQEAHLPYLIATLTQWVLNSTEEDVVALSIGVLVNLCYKNLPATYTLMRSVDTKVFVKTIIKVHRGNINTRVQCCKLFIALEQVHRELSDSDILDFTEVTFASLVRAMEDKDTLLLRHTIDFFNEVRQNDHYRVVLSTYPSYTISVKNILATLENYSDAECVGLVMDFLVCLIRLQIPSLVLLYSSCVEFAMTWIPVEQVCSKALSLIKTVVTDIRRVKGSVDTLNELDLAILMLVLDNENKIGADNYSHTQSVESQSKLTEFLQLLQEMVRIPSIRPKVMQAFTHQTMRQILAPILDQGDGNSCETGPGNLFLNPATTLHVYALSLTADLAANDSNWLTLYSELLIKKQIQMVMALALFTGDIEVKQRVLELIVSVGFTQDCLSAVACCMGELAPLVLVQGGTVYNPTSRDQCRGANGFSNEVQTPLFSLAQEGRLDLLISRLEHAAENNQIQDITTSAVMELYEYKLAAMKHAERATQASLEAASSHATSLQHRLAQVIAESSRLHQLLFYTQQCLEGSQKERLLLLNKIKDAETQNIRMHSTQVQEIKSLRKIVQEKSDAIEQMNLAISDYGMKLQNSEAKNETLKKKVDDLVNENKTSDIKTKELTTKLNELSRVIRKMEEGTVRQKQILDEKTKEIAFSQNQISALKSELQEQTEQCRTQEQVIMEKDESLKKLREELSEFTRMRDMIFQITAKKKEENAS